MLLLVSAVTGFLLALHAYVTPLTGVTGTLGALTVIVACAALGMMAASLRTATSQTLRIVLRMLIGLALAGTCFAALMLHEWWLCVAMGVGVVGLVLDLVQPASANRAAYS